MSNYLSPFQQWQLAKHGNILPEQQDREEFEYWNLESKEASEWSKKQVDNELQDQN